MLIHINVTYLEVEAVYLSISNFFYLDLLKATIISID